MDKLSFSPERRIIENAKRVDRAHISTGITLNASVAEKGQDKGPLAPVVMEDPIVARSVFLVRSLT